MHYRIKMAVDEVMAVEAPQKPERGSVEYAQGVIDLLSNALAIAECDLIRARVEAGEVVKPRGTT